jgi:hypothetical protein
VGSTTQHWIHSMALAAYRTCLLNVTGCHPSTRLRKGTSVNVRLVSTVAKYAQVPSNMASSAYGAQGQHLAVLSHQ